MTATVVVDSSALVALVADAGRDGEWVVGAVAGAALAAPELALFEAANVLRRLELAGELEAGEAALAHDDLLALRVQAWPYLPLAARVWELRQSLTSYDAAYVAVAEVLGAPLVTLDRRLARAPGPRCAVRAPDTTGPDV